MRKLIASLAFALTLTACASNPAPTLKLEPKVVTKTVTVPVATACVKNVSPAPVYPDTNDALKNASGADVRYQLLAAGHPLRVAREAELERIVKICSK